MEGFSECYEQCGRCVLIGAILADWAVGMTTERGVQGAPGVPHTYCCSYSPTKCRQRYLLEAGLPEALVVGEERLLNYLGRPPNFRF